MPLYNMIRLQKEYYSMISSAASFKIFTVGLWLLLVLLFPLGAKAEGPLTLTSTMTSTSLADNPALGCQACRGIPDPSAPFPDTSKPVFSGDPAAALLPAIIAHGLPPNNQFGVGVPAGRSGMPISSSHPFILSDGGMVIGFDNQFQSIPLPNGGNGNVIRMPITQVTPGATPTGDPQVFSIFFSIVSLTDPDGNLAAGTNASGTFTQVINGVSTQGSVQFNSATGFTGTNLHPDFNGTSPPQ